jgi:hypothetical protein
MRVLLGLNIDRDEGRGSGKALAVVTCHSWPAAVPDLGGKRGETEKE